jgi:hypothetical protein
MKHKICVLCLYHIDKKRKDYVSDTLKTSHFSISHHNPLTFLFLYGCAPDGLRAVFSLLCNVIPTIRRQSEWFSFDSNSAAVQQQTLWRKGHQNCSWRSTHTSSAARAISAHFQQRRAN